MDNAKKRKFLDCYDLLPPSVKAHYESIRGKSGKQRDTTMVINAAVHRSAEGKLTIPQKPRAWLQQSVQVGYSKYQDNYGEGMLEEEVAHSYERIKYFFFVFENFWNVYIYIYRC